MHRPGVLGVGMLRDGGGRMSETLTTARRATLHRRVRFIVGFTITYNVIEAVVAIAAGSLASSGALIGFAGQRVIESTIREKLPEGFQRAEYLLAHGMLDMVVHRRDLRERLAQVIGYLCGNRDAAAA